MNDWNQILVGIDGGQGGYAAIRFAADEARRTGAMLRLVHVIPQTVRTPSPYSVLYPLAPVESRRIGSELLAAARGRAEKEVGPDRVRTSLLNGGVVPSLVQAAASAHLVVLGDRDRPALGRIITGSVLVGVAAHAPVPVVAVPASWRPREDTRRVVVAVRDCGDSEWLIGQGLTAAAERGDELVVLHAWALPTVYDDMTTAHLDRPEWAEQSVRTLTNTLSRVVARAAGPIGSVPTRVDVCHGQAARVIADAAADADLVIIGRRRHGFPVGRLGGTGRAVLRESLGPVEVLPPGVETVSVDDLVLEHDGVFEKAADMPSAAAEVVGEVVRDDGARR